MHDEKYSCNFSNINKRPQRMKEYIDGLLEDGIIRIASTPMEPRLTASEGFVRKWEKLFGMVDVLMILLVSLFMGNMVLMPS